MLEALLATLDLAVSTRETRVVVLRANGPVFCAGLDLGEALDDHRAHASAELVAQVLKRIASLPQLTIAAVHGAAMAGGAGLMSACDIIVAAENVKVGYPEVRRGLVAAIVMTFLRRRLREADARMLLLLGEPVDALVARSMGLVSHVVSESRVMEVVEACCAQALKGAPGAIAATKQLWNDLYATTVEEDVAKALALHKAMRTSTDAREGMRAFAEKRLPHWDPASNK